jgi:hypothetical protein
MKPKETRQAPSVWWICIFTPASENGGRVITGKGRLIDGAEVIDGSEVINGAEDGDSVDGLEE